MTEQEYAEKVLQMWADWAESGERDLHFPTILASEHNSNVINTEVRKFFNNSGRAIPRPKELSGLIRGLGDIAKGGRVQYDHSAPEPVNPALNMPDADEPLLKNLRCYEDLNERGAQISKKVMSLGGGAGGADAMGRDRGNELLEKLNRRIAWIQNNKIRRDDLPPSDAPKTPQLAKPVVTVPSEILEAHKLVDSMTIADVGETGDGAGRHTLLPIRMKKFHRDIDERYAKRESPESILENTKTLIKDSGSGSIR